MASMKNDAENGGSAREEGLDKVEQALKIMGLTSEEERATFERVRSWWEGRSFRMSIQADPIVVAAVVSRALLCFHTGFHVDSTENHKTTPSPLDDKAALSTPDDASKPSTVSPDDDAALTDADDSKERTVLSANGNAPASSHLRSSQVELSGPREGISTDSTVDSTAKDTGQTKGGNENGIQNLASKNYRFEYFFSIASDLAILLDAIDTRKEQKEGAASSVVAPPTAGFILSTFVKLLSSRNEQTPSMVATDLHRTIFHQFAPQSEIIESTKLLHASLEAASRATTTAAEAYYDFEYLWASCTGNSSSFLEAIESLAGEDEKDEHEEASSESAAAEEEKNGNGKRPSANGSTSSKNTASIKEYARKLSYLTSLRSLRGELNQISYLSNLRSLRGELNQPDKSSRKPSPKARNVAAFGRRRRILATAACFGLLSSLPKASSEAATENEKDSEQASRSGKETDSSQVSSTPAPKKRRTMEEDAIAALSMMVNGSFEAAPAEAPAESKKSVPPIEMVLHSANALLSSLRLSSSKVSLDLTPRFTLGKLEDAVLELAKQLASAVPQSEKAKSTEVDDSSTFTEKLQALLPTNFDFDRLMNDSPLDELIAASLRDIFQTMTAQMDITDLVGFPFVDESLLHPPRSHVVPRLCLTSSKANNVGAALICPYDGCPGETATPQESQAAEAMTAFMAEAHNRAMREGMELNEWTVSILDLSEVRPSTRLMLYLEASDDESVKQKRKRPDGVSAEVTTGGGWRSVIVPVLNRVIGRMIDEEPIAHESATHSPLSRVAVSSANGEVIVRGDDDDAEICLCQSLVALFYHSLESILYHETARLKSASHPKLLLSEPFHRALLTCCCICLMKGLCSSGALALSEKYLNLDFPCIQRIMESGPYTYLKVSESFARALKLDKTGGKLRSPLALGLPRTLQRQLSQCEVLVMDSLLWAHESTFALDICVMDVVADYKYVPNKRAVSAWPPEVLQPTLPEEIDDWKDQNDRSNGKMRIVKRTGPIPPDHFYLSYLLRKLLKIAFFRISAFCNALTIPPEYPIASQVWIAFRYLLRHNIELLYDRHVDQLILCTLYGVCKIMKFQPELTFSKIIEIYTQVRGAELGERACHRLVRHIKLITDEDAMDTVDSDLNTPPKKKKKRTYGNVIHLYNDVFVPAMKTHLLQSKSLKKAIANLKKCMAAQGKKKKPESTIDDCIMAARADEWAHDSGNWANEPATIPVTEGNVKLNIRLPTSSENMYNHKLPLHPHRKPRGRPKRADSRESPDSRVFYCFGEASGQSIELMNRIVAEG